MTNRRSDTTGGHQVDFDDSRTSALTQLWREVLGIEDIAPTDTFLELGGSSLQAIALLSLIQQRFAVRPTVADLIAAPTVAQLAARIDELGAESFNTRGSTTVPLRPRTIDNAVGPLFCIAGSGGSAWSFVPLTAALPSAIPVYAFHQRGLEHRAVPEWSMARFTRRILAEIRRIQPHGPYRLAGHSMGGVAAIEIARQLEIQGEQVELVILLDVTIPTSTSRHLSAAALPGPQENKRGLISRLRLYRQLLTAGIVRHPLGIQQEVFYELGLRMQNRHSLKPWSGRIISVNTRDTAHEEELRKTLLTGDPQFVLVEGDHMSVVREGPITTMIADLVTGEIGPGQLRA